jgi:RHS repeat-associated protein
MDKPQKITIESKSITEFIYDAAGIKLAKTVKNLTTNASRVTWYMGGFIYEEILSSSGGTVSLDLQMILHEEGRIRVYSPVSNPRLAIAANFDLPDNKKGVFDFFIKDNLQNTRAIVTEETHSEFNNATMEDANSYYEERMFGQVDVNGNPLAGNNEVSGTRYEKQQWAPGWNANSSAKISKIGRFGKTVGPNMMLKVMAGDNVAAKTDYYYNETPDNTGTNNILPSIVGSLLSSLSYTAPTGSLHNAAGNITNTINTNPGDLGNFLNSQNTGTNATPQAYMNILFFDENFNFVPYDNVTGLGSYGWRVGAGGDGQGIPIQIAKAPKNGYAFVYVSNKSKTYVYFDNLEVTHVRGRLIEENAYYPYGLKIKGISGKAFDKGDNKYGYQASFSEEDAETGWDEFGLRMYDAQIGRWTGVDPEDQFASPYLGMGGQPIGKIDVGGRATWPFHGQEPVGVHGLDAAIRVHRRQSQRDLQHPRRRASRRGSRIGGGPLGR